MEEDARSLDDSSYENVVNLAEFPGTSFFPADRGSPSCNRHKTSVVPSGVLGRAFKLLCKLL